MKNNVSQILNTASKYLPQTSDNCQPLTVLKAKGSYFWDLNGKKYLDFTSGIFTNSFGHCYKPIVKKHISEIKKNDNVHGRITPAEVEFYNELSTFMPEDEYSFIPYNDGGYAIDRALTDIVNHFNKQKITIAAFKGGFHGKTMATKLLINETQEATFFKNIQLDFPYCYHCPLGLKAENCAVKCAKLACEKLLQNNVKVLIFEPVQGAKIVIPPKAFFEEITSFCKKNNILIFADEILTGGGRTGFFLASLGLYNIKADIISLTKGLANGLPLSIICEKKFLTQNKYSTRPLEHSSTFARHPHALGVAAETLRQIRKKKILNHVPKISCDFKADLEKLYKFSFVGDIRCIGLMAGIEIVKDKASKESDYLKAKEIFNSARLLGLEMILSGHILRLAPPLNISIKDLKKGLSLLEKAMEGK